MFQYVWFDKSKWTGLQIPPLPEDYITFRDMERIAPLYWAEHCVECAVPQCYGTCLNWEPRVDRKCRRFVYGIHRTGCGESYAATLKLKKWGKAEARLPGKRFLSPRRAKRLDRVNYFLSNGVRGISSALRWLSPTFKLSGALEAFKHGCFCRMGKQESRGQFLFTAYLHEENSVVLFLEIVHEGRTYERKALDLHPGFNQILLEIAPESYPENALCRLFGSEGLSCQLTVYFADFVILKDSGSKKLLPTETKPAAKVKCVVWDLDHTVWDGILMESQADSLKLKPHVRETMEWLDARGIIQCVASKNDHDDALRELKRLGIDHFFVDLAINWRTKSLNLADMAKAINININTFAFIDDSPFERGQVRELLPSVRVFEENQLPELQKLDAFDVPVTEESILRRAMYQTEYRRREYRTSEGLGQVDFLLSCNLKARLCPIETEDQEQRALELIHRTNQLNLSGRRYTREAFHQILEDPTRDVFTLYLEDRFGSYGQAMVIIVENQPDRLVIGDLAISCRIAGKYAESAALSTLRAHYGQKDLHLIGTNSKKNRLLIQTLTDIGFQKQSSDEDPRLILLHPKNTPFLNNHVVRVAFQGRLS